MEITDINKTIKHALKYPISNRLDELPQYIQGLIWSWTTYCIDNNVGNLQNAHKIKDLIAPVLKHRLSENYPRSPPKPAVKLQPKPAVKLQPKPAVKLQPKPALKLPSNPAQQNSLFLKYFAADDWECPTCMLSNQNSDTACIACNTPKDSGPRKPGDLIPENTLVKTFIPKPNSRRAIFQTQEKDEDYDDSGAGYSTYDNRGFKSLMTAFVMMRNSNLKNNMCVQIHINNSHSPAIKVYYNTDPSFKEPMFFIYQTYTPLGLDSEPILYSKDLKEYMAEILSRRSKSDSFNFKITKINIIIYNQIKRFYIDSLGIIWNNEECADCHLKKLSDTELDHKCRSLIDSNCSNNFRNSPDSKVTPVSLPKITVKKSPPIDIDHKGIKSIITACKDSLPKLINTTIDVYINKKPSPIFKISYESTTDKRTAENGIYTVIKFNPGDTSDEMYTYDFENLKLFMNTIFTDNSVDSNSYIVTKINLNTTGKSTKTFYTNPLI